MFSRKNAWTAAFVSALALLSSLCASAQSEPQGLLLYQQPSTSFTEAFEYRSFRQENALYATLVNAAGERKQLKAGGVLAAVPYPPRSFEADFGNTAHATIAKIDSLGRSYPAVRAPLEKARGKWLRALSVFEQHPPVASETPASSALTTLTTLSLSRGILHHVRLTKASPGTATLTHASGIAVIPIAELTAAQILDLNGHATAVQLPLGISRPAAPAQRETGGLTSSIGAAGRSAVSFCAGKIGVDETVFGIWALYVVFPGMVLLLLLSLILSRARRTAPEIKSAVGKK